jgi:hypothetical protein
LSFGYSPSRVFTDVTTLHLPGWAAIGENRQVSSLTLPNLNDDALRTACGLLGRTLLQSPQATEGATQSFADALQPGAWDTLYTLLRLAGPLGWSDVPAAQRNIVTGGPAAAGQVDSAGNFVPTASNGVIAGFGLPSPAIKLGKRFAFASDPDVHFYLYLDKDAFADDMSKFVTGAGLQFGGKTSDGTELKLRIGVGRDQAGGGAGFVTLRIGPDFAPITPGR